MHLKDQVALEERVRHAAETALADHHYVSAIDVLLGMGLLAPRHVDEWRKGRIDILEQAIQGSPQKISYSLTAFREWAEVKGLKPSETSYVRSTREGTLDLRFSISGDPDIKKSYRTHYVSPVLSERTREKLQKRLDRKPQPVVFQIVRDSKCIECGVELPSDSLLYLEAEQPLCLACAGMGELEYLEAGDAALTRRATKYSSRTAVVVRFSRSRGRYERQGILVEHAAVEQAERECLADADARAAARARGAVARAGQDRDLVARMTKEIRAMFPGLLAKEAASIAAHTAARGSGRVGRTAAGRNLDEQGFAGRGYRRSSPPAHRLRRVAGTSGVERSLARQRVGERVEAMLDEWRNPER